MKIQKTLSNALETEYIPVTDLVPVDEQGKEVAKLSDDAEVDFKDARDTLQELIKTGCDAVKDMHQIAQGDEAARSFEVLATLIKTVSETTEKLLNTHEQKNRLKGGFEGRKIAEPPGGVQVDKAIFVGTTSDLLKQLKSKDQ